MKSLAPENLEKLFLFEVYVEDLSIDYPKLCLTQNCLNSLKETIIQCQFLGFQPVEIREDEFMGDETNCGNRKVNAGKSCLFSLRDMPREVRCLEVDVKVIRRTVQNATIGLAATSIKLGEQFTDILKSSRVKKLSTSLKKPFTLFDKRCREVGKITVNINLSCFGKLITTSFQLDGDDSKAYVVQPGGEIPIADFLKSESSLNKGLCPERYGYSLNRPAMIPSNYLPTWRPPMGLLGGFAPPPPQMGVLQVPMQPIYRFQGGYSGQWPAQGGYSGQWPAQGGYSGQWPAQGGCSGQWPAQGGYSGQWPAQGGLLGGSQPSAPPLPKPMLEPPRSKESSDSSSSDESPPPPPFQICGCDYPLPPGFLAPAPIKKKKKKKKKDTCPLGMMQDFCLNPNCPKGYPQLPVVEEIHQVCQAMEVLPGVIGMKGEQMMFQLPSDNQPIPGNRKAHFRFGGGPNSNLKDVRIMTDGETKKFTVPTKTNDIYVIKVGKTNQETDLRQKMVLEVKQPRPPTDDRTFYDIRTQYLEADFMTEQPKKDKKKGKKGKGKKGKKGKGKKGKKK